jgi:hypothetical protein
VVYYFQAVGDDERPETDRIYVRPGVTEHHFMGWTNFFVRSELFGRKDHLPGPD